jgi:predicted nucleic acid-binding protein
VNLRPVVLDAAALLDLLVARDIGLLVEPRVAGGQLHVAAHVEAEVLSGLHRLEEIGVMGSSVCEEHLATLAAAPIERHPVPDVIEGAWRRRRDLRLADALSVELARSLGTTLITTDPRLTPDEGADEIVEVIRIAAD